MDAIPKDDICVMLPNKMVQDMGEDNPLPSAIYLMVVGMMSAGYGPSDFGEEHETHTELHFTPAKDKELVSMTKNFSEKGGWV